MAPVHVAALLAHPAVRGAIERALAARGVRGDTMIAHLNPREAAMLQMLGGSGTINPQTGFRQFDDEGTKAGGGTSGDTGVSGGGTNQGGYGRASDTGGGGYGPFGALGSAISGVGGFLDRLGGNFGQGWASRGVAGGYGGATSSPSGGGRLGASSGSGAGAGGGHSGQNYISQTYGGLPQVPAAVAPAPLPAAPVISNMPVAPVSLDPMMSATGTPTDLAAGRFGTAPAWADQAYQIGTAPSAYPTPGVNAGLGAPGFAGNPLPDQTGGGGILGGGGIPGAAVAGLPSYFGQGNPIGGTSALAGKSLQQIKAMNLSPGALNRLLTPMNRGPGLTMPIGGTSPLASRSLQQILAMHLSPGALARLSVPSNQGSPPIFPGQQRPAQAAPVQYQQQQQRPMATLPGPAMGYVAPRPVAAPIVRPVATTTLTPAQRLAAQRLMAARTGGKNFG